MPSEIPTQSVLEEIRVALFRKGISQMALAEELGMSQSAVSRRLHGDVPATVDELQKFATAAGVTLTFALANETVAS
ncbi:MAG: helix-turn-helix transcriptional regulator [Pseudolysinimonas sp.]